MLMGNLLSKLVSAPVCQVCGQPARDLVGSHDEASVLYYCRAHALRAFAKAFLEFDHSRIVVHPLGTRAGSGLLGTGFLADVGDNYDYVTLSEFGTKSDLAYEFLKDPDARTAVSAALDAISGKSCARCGAVARVAYFDEPAARSFDIELEQESLPDFSSHDAAYLCNEHAFEAIRPALEANPPFDGAPLTLPSEGPGIHLTVFL
jgi:hypothetical protein